MVVVDLIAQVICRRVVVNVDRILTIQLQLVIHLNNVQILVLVSMGTFANQEILLAVVTVQCVQHETVSLVSVERQLLSLRPHSLCCHPQFH